jgi:Zn-dependent protease
VRPSSLFLGLLGATVIGAVLCALTPYDPFHPRSWPLTVGIILFIIGGWLVSLCLHEFGHALVAYRGGDHEVARRGYLSLDPRLYTDPVLTFVLPVFYLIIGGLPLPGGAVLINHWALRSKPVETMVSLAGPLFNLVIGFALILADTLLPMPDGLYIAFSYLAYLQVLTFLFNILPVPGFDGFNAIAPWLSREAQALAVRVRPWATLAVFLIIFGLPQAGAAIRDAGDWTYQLLGGRDDNAVALGDLLFRFWLH